jgi:hypothetical protein
MCGGGTVGIDTGWFEVSVWIMSLICSGVREATEASRGRDPSCGIDTAPAIPAGVMKDCGCTSGGSIEGNGGTMGRVMFESGGPVKGCTGGASFPLFKTQIPTR